VRGRGKPRHRGGPSVGGIERSATACANRPIRKKRHVRMFSDTAPVTCWQLVRPWVTEKNLEILYKGAVKAAPLGGAGECCLFWTNPQDISSRAMERTQYDPAPLGLRAIAVLIALLSALALLFSSVPPPLQTYQLARALPNGGAATATWSARHSSGARAPVLSHFSPLPK
jgi:hypothetical protein